MDRGCCACHGFDKWPVSSSAARGGGTIGEHMSLTELLDERRHLLGVIADAMGHRATGDHVLRCAYARWFALPRAERAAIPDPRTWLTAVTEEVCAHWPARDDMECAAQRGARPPNAAPATAAAPSDPVAQAFLVACRDADDLLFDVVLAPGVRALADGGGLVRVHPDLLSGAADVGAFLCALFGGQGELGLRDCRVNGDAGVVVHRERAAVAVIGLRCERGRVQEVWLMLNPDKVRRWDLP